MSSTALEQRKRLFLSAMHMKNSYYENWKEVQYQYVYHKDACILSGSVMTQRTFTVSIAF